MKPLDSRQDLRDCIRQCPPGSRRWLGIDELANRYGVAPSEVVRICEEVAPETVKASPPSVIPSTLSPDVSNNLEWVKDVIIGADATQRIYIPPELFRRRRSEWFWDEFDPKLMRVLHLCIPLPVGLLAYVGLRGDLTSLRHNWLILALGLGATLFGYWPVDYRSRAAKAETDYTRTVGGLIICCVVVFFLCCMAGAWGTLSPGDMESRRP
jgi:hypothetical protein